jgi:hypothetical protein
MVLRVFAIGFLFEHVVMISMFPFDPGDERGGEIERNKKWAPTFILRDMYMLVQAVAANGAFIDAEDDVSEGHGAAVAEEAPENPGGKAAPGFDRAGANLDGTSGDGGQQDEDHAKEGYRKDPNISE